MHMNREGMPGGRVHTLKFKPTDMKVGNHVKD